jgi:hypothetical protein
MATLDSNDLQFIRNKMTEKTTVNYTKSQINAAAQAVEDWLDLPANRSSLNTAINSAMGGNILTTAQKQQIFLCVVLKKSLREY